MPPNVKKINIPDAIVGLTDAEVINSRKQSGTMNKYTQAYLWMDGFLELFKEPMLILLIAVAIIYFILGQTVKLILC
jgi:Ca2+-transporting ATPase